MDCGSGNYDRPMSAIMTRISNANTADVVLILIDCALVIWMDIFRRKSTTSCCFDQRADLEFHSKPQIWSKHTSRFPPNLLGFAQRPCAVYFLCQRWGRKQWWEWILRRSRSRPPWEFPVVSARHSCCNASTMLKCSSGTWNLLTIPSRLQTVLNTVIFRVAVFWIPTQVVQNTLSLLIGFEFLCCSCLFTLREESRKLQSGRCVPLCFLYVAYIYADLACNEGWQCNDGVGRLFYCFFNVSYCSYDHKGCTAGR